MESTMDAALKHARHYAQYLNKCDSTYMIQISLKELGIFSGHEGFHFAKNTIHMLEKTPIATLSHGIYVAAGFLTGSSADDDQVEQAIRNVIHNAWKERDETIWRCYFPIGRAGRSRCPTNKEFLMAVVDFIQLWKAFCEEINYGQK